MDQEKIGRLIKKLRQDNQLSQKAFADKYGVTYQAVSKWENGKNIPDIALLKNICQDYKIDINDLLDGKVNKKSSNWTIILMVVVLVLGFSIFFVISKSKNDIITLNNISSSCEDFVINGSIAYNTNKGFISINEINYCGKEFDQDYDRIVCLLIESSSNNTKELDRIESNGKNNLRSFLSTVKFNVANYVKMCKTYDDTNLFLEIILYNGEGTRVSHKVPLKLESVCS